MKYITLETFSSELIELSKLYRGITYVHMVDEGHKVKLCRSHGQNVDNQLWFWKYSPNFFVFKCSHILGLFCTFLGPLGLFFGPLGLFLESGSGSKTFLKPTYVVNQL